MQRERKEKKRRPPLRKKSKENITEEGGEQRASNVYLIAGLGNPGLRYRQTRHNIGYRVITLWARRLGAPLTSRRFRSRNTLTRFQGRDLVLLRPQTFMNQSGRSIKACLDFYGIDAANLLVVHDDIDLPVGRIRVVRGGGGGGHRGVLSVIEQTGSSLFARVRIGVGRPRYGEPIEEYVLSSFYREEGSIMDEVVRVAVRGCELFLTEGLDSAMNQINWQKIGEKEVKN